MYSNGGLQVSKEVDDSLTQKRDIVAFVHTYQADGQFDPYMSSVINAFKTLGLRVHLVRTNDIFSHLGGTILNAGVNIDKVVELINEINPAFIFTTNRGGITQEIMEQTSCPIITRMVDLVPFYHQGGADEPLFCDRDYVFVPTLESVRSFEKRFPVLKGKVSYLPFATDPDAFDALSNVEKNISVSFVGTYFYCDSISKVFSDLQHDSKWRELFFRLVGDIEKDFHLHFEELDYAADIVALCGQLDMDAETLRMQVSNLHALNKRIHYLDAVADLGLMLYGTSNWIQVNHFSVKLLQCFQFDESIDSREKLIKLYQRSKIALNVPHHQAGAGMPYRVYDIMASSALLITEYHEDSELFSLFGKDVPIPMYSNATELRNLVEYYLEHEDERQAIVAKCNTLIREKNITFMDRAQSYCLAAKVEPDINQYGKVFYIKHKLLGWQSSELKATKATEAIQATEATEAMHIKERIASLMTWVLPYQLCLYWQVNSGYVALTSEVSVDRKILKRFRWLLVKLKIMIGWIIPYRILLLLKALLRGV